MNKEHTLLRRETGQIKAATSEKNDEFATDKLRLLQVQQENARLKQQVVRSPKKLRQTLRNMKSMVEEQKGDVASSSSRLIALRSRRQALTEFHQTLEKRVATMRECQSQSILTKTQATLIKEAQSGTEQQQRQAQTLALEERQLAESIAAIQNKLHTLSVQSQKQSQAAQSALDQVLEHKRQLEAEKVRDDDEASHNDAVLVAKRKQLEEMQAAHARERDSVISRQQLLAERLSAYHKKLLLRMR
jgi:hypothetical protein